MGGSCVILIFILLCTIQFSLTFKVLGIFPMPVLSHFKIPAQILENLALRGHNVTVVSHFGIKSNISGYREMLLQNPDAQFTNMFHIKQFQSGSKFDRYYGTATRVIKYHKLLCDQLEQQAFQELLKANDTYDIIFMELFSNDCLSVFADKFKVPIVGFTTCCPLPWVGETLGLPLESSYVSNVLLGYSNDMTFLQRLDNSLASIWHLLFYKYVISPKDDIYASKYYKDSRVSHILKGRTNVVLSNCHFSLNFPRTIVPGLVQIAGILQKEKPLKKNLEKWISEAKDGVIYFSMGSILKGHTLPKDKKDAFLKAFARLPQRVLWKWESDEMEDKPDNVMIQKWMPQFDILSHPNVKAFISHGGLLGTIEAVHCGVPMIVMPQFGDQHTNAQAIKGNGGGLILPLSQVTEESVLEALNTVLSSSFREQAKQLSQRFRDRPLPPLDTAIYWIEYVARHKGAAHMRTAAVDMPFYQYYLLDVFAFLFLVLSLSIYITFVVIKTVVKLVTKSANKVKTS